MKRFLKFYVLIFIFIISGCIKNPPGFAEYNLGVGLFERGEFEEAAELFRQATEKNPQFAEAYMNLGTSLYQLEQYREALYAYEKSDSLFREGYFVDIRGIDHEQKLPALETMLEVTHAQVKLLDTDNLTEEEIEELRRVVEDE